MKFNINVYMVTKVGNAVKRLFLLFIEKWADLTLFKFLYHNLHSRVHIYEVDANVPLFDLSNTFQQFLFDCAVKLGFKVSIHIYV